MKNQALFSSKDKSQKLKCRLLQFLFGALRVNGNSDRNITQLPVCSCERNLQGAICMSTVNRDKRI